MTLTTEKINGLRSKIRKTCWRFLSRYPSEIEDLVEDVIVLVIEKSWQFRGESQLETWVYRITANQAINRLRKLRKEECLSLNALIDIKAGDVLFEEVLIAENSLNPVMVIEGLVTLKAMYAAMGWLRDNYQNDYNAFTSAVLLDYSYEQVAELFGITVSAVKSRIFRTRESLRKQLRKELREQLHKGRA